MAHEKLYRRFCGDDDDRGVAFDPEQADAGRLTPARLAALRGQLASEPSFTLDVARRSLDAELTPRELDDLLAQAAAGFEDEDATVQFVDLAIALGLGKTT